jgi:hypothetical protein
MQVGQSLRDMVSLEIAAPHMAAPPPARGPPAATQPAWAAAGRRGSATAASRYEGASISGAASAATTGQRGYGQYSGHAARGLYTGGNVGQTAGLTDLDAGHAEVYDTMASIFSADMTEDAPLPPPRDAHRVRMAHGGGAGGAGHTARLPPPGPAGYGYGQAAPGPAGQHEGGEDTVTPLPVLVPTGAGHGGRPAGRPPGAGTPVKLLRRRGLSLDMPGAHRELAQTLAATGALAGQEEAEAFSSVFEQLASATGAAAAAAASPQQGAGGEGRADPGAVAAAPQVTSHPLRADKDAGRGEQGEGGGAAAARHEGRQEEPPPAGGGSSTSARSPAVSAIRAAVGGGEGGDQGAPLGYEGLGPRAGSASKYAPRAGHAPPLREGFFEISPVASSSVADVPSFRSAAAAGSGPSSGPELGSGGAEAAPAAGAAAVGAGQGGDGAARASAQAAAAVAAGAPSQPAAVLSKGFESMTLRDLLGVLVSTLQSQQGTAGAAAADLPVGQLLQLQQPGR